MRPKVLVISQLPGTAINRLKVIADVEVYKGERELSKEELKNLLCDKDGVVSLLVDQFDDEIFESAPNLKIVANYAVGYNNIDIKAATERGIIVTNTPDVLTESTADLTWALLLGASRRIIEGDQFIRSGQFKGWGPTLLLGRSISNKTLGIIGMGRIGQAVAARAKGFNMDVLYYNRRALAEELERDLNAKYVSLEVLLEQSDFVSLHAPLTSESHHVIGEQELMRMKKSAYLINTSRGPLVDEKALVKALQDNEIAGAGLDVFENEPRLEQGLTQLFNVVLAPHVGSATIETRAEMADLAIDNVISVLQGEKPLTPVNPEALKFKRSLFK